MVDFDPLQAARAGGAVWVEFRPEWAPHVNGRYARRTFDPETGQADDQAWTAHCTKCGQSWQGKCSSGQVKQHIQRFARVHLHRDPFDPIQGGGGR